MNQQQQVAMFWLAQGIATIPILYRSKRPSFMALARTGDIDQNGKPTWERLKTELPSKLDILQWYDPLSNIAVICGWQNLVIVDFDDLVAYDTWMQIYGQEGWADTYTVCTGRGYHLYYYIEDIPAYTMKWTGGEIKASGYCLCPPSIHPSGARYKATENEIMDIGSIYDILPESVFRHEAEPCRRLPQNNPFAPHPQGQYSSVKDTARILSFFPDARRTGNGWYTVYCPFHGDGTQRGHASGWIDDNRNRFGCHACINGSLSVIDFYMRLNGVDTATAIQELK